MKRPFPLFFIFLLALAAGCSGGGGDNSGTPSSEPSPPSSFTSLDAISILDLPEGALPAGVSADDITAVATTAPQLPGASVIMAYQFGPDGMRFLKPITLSFHIDGIIVDAKIIHVSGNTFEVLESTMDQNSGLISAQIDHFSIYAVAVVGDDAAGRNVPPQAAAPAPPSGGQEGLPPAPTQEPEPAPLPGEEPAPAQEKILGNGTIDIQPDDALVPAGQAVTLTMNGDEGAVIRYTDSQLEPSDPNCSTSKISGEDTRLTVADDLYVKAILCKEKIQVSEVFKKQYRTYLGKYPYVGLYGYYLDDPEDQSGWTTSVATGVATDADGNVYVTNIGTHRVEKIDPAGRPAAFFGGKGSATGELLEPSGVAVDREKNIYVADTGNNRIQKRDARSGSWSVLGGGKGSEPGQFNKPGGIAIDRDGNLYVADRLNARIQVRDALTGAWRVLDRSGGPQPDQFGDPAAVAVDAAGNVYVLDHASENVSRLQPREGIWTVWTSNWLLDRPMGLSVDDRGLVYVADGHYVKVLDSNTGAWSELNLPGDEGGLITGHFSTASGVAVDRNRNIFVVDSGIGRVQKFDAQRGAWVDYNDAMMGYDPGQFYIPYGVAVDAAGNIYVADTGNYRIQKFDRQGRQLLTLGEYGYDLPGTFVVPSAIAIDADENIYVADKGNWHIHKYNVQRGIWTFDDPSERLPRGIRYLAQAPTDIVIDAAGTIYVVSSRNNRLLRRVSGGAWSLLPAPGADVGALKNPSRLAVDRRGNVFVTDTENNRVLKLEGNMKWSVLSRGMGSEAGQFEGPSGIAVDAAGNVFVTDPARYNRIQRLSSANGDWTARGRQGAGMDEFNSPMSIAVDAAGNIYVADIWNHRIQKMRW